MASANDPSYAQLMELGKKSFDLGYFRKAVVYFTLAELKAPAQEEPRNYRNLIKRIRDGRAVVVELDANRTARLVTQAQIENEDSLLSADPQTAPGARSVDAGTRPAKDRPRMPPVAPSYAAPKTRSSPPRPIGQEAILKMDDSLWATQPKTYLQLEKDKYLILEGDEIERFLIVTEGSIAITRLSRDQIKVAGVTRGTTIVHVWDSRGRWTFNVETIFPQIFLFPGQEQPEDKAVTLARPFTFAYSSDWNAFYTGEDPSALERDTLNFNQWAGIYGETPYGKLDGSARFTKYAESTELTGYGGGLESGQFGDFRNFSIRGGDVSRRFSALSLPGKYFRGGYLDAYAFDNSINYTLLRGRDRAIFTYVSPGTLDTKESFLEGAQITLFPKTAHTYSFNFARGFGDGREDFLKDKVFSVETEHKIKKWQISGENAYDEKNSARMAGLQYKVNERAWWKINLRDIEPDFTTITGFPAGQGEAGGNFLFNWTPAPFALTTGVDVFRDRLLSNPEDPNALNYDINNSVVWELDKSSSIRNSIYFTDFPGMISPRTTFRTNTTYSRSFGVWGGRTLTTFVGGNYQQSRYENSVGGEYDRYGISSGFRFPIIANLYYFLNYDYDWVTDVATSENSNPNVVSTGLNYSKQLTRSLSGRWGITYRNEEEAGGSFSFLAGEDSLSGTAGLSFRPSQDVEVYADGRLRDVVSEVTGNPDFAEGDIRVGMRSSWDLLVRWSKSGVVRGIVFKDFNANGYQDDPEEGLENVKVKVGDVEVLTNGLGEYRAKVSAQDVTVAIDPESLPQGFIVSEALTKRVEILHRDTQIVNFALTSQSGIYGVVYFDQNANGKLDPSDTFIPMVKITLDGGETLRSAYDGTYLFKNVLPGKHIVQLDLNTVPLEYLPLVKIRTEIEVSEGTTYLLHIPLKKK